MAITYFPFDAGDGANVTEAQWRQMARHWRRTGVLADEGDEFEVSASSPAAMSVSVGTGEAWLRGHFVSNDADLAVAIADADLTNPRIDRVVLRADFGANTMSVEVLEGTPAGSPTAPALTQSVSTWEESLAQVAVAAGASSIIAANITDERVISRTNIVPVVTALPDVANDGDEVIYTPASQECAWHLRYDSSVGDAYKWRYVGGRPMVSASSGGSLPNGAHADLGPSITLPLAGIYDYEGGCYWSTTYLNGAQNGVSLYVASTTLASASSGVIGNWASGNPSVDGSTFIPLYRDAARAAATVAKLRGGGFPGATMGYKYLAATPVRVG